MLFNSPHIAYMIVSGIIIVCLLVSFQFIKQQKWKDFILKLSAILTVAIHFSSLYFDYFTTGQATVEAPMLLPIYPCNVAMWLLVIVAFWKNKNSKAFSYVAEFTFYLGVAGAVVGVMFNEIYASNPTLASWGVLKGLLSHSVMLLGCVYLLTGKYIKIRVRNTLSLFCGLIFLLVDGGIIIGLYRMFKQEPPNCMYMLSNPFPAISWFNTYMIGVLALVLVFVLTALVEQFSLPKEERWYSKLKNLKFKKENNQ